MTQAPCKLCEKDRSDCSRVDCVRREHWGRTDYKQGRQGPVEPKLVEERPMPYRPLA